MLGLGWIYCHLLHLCGERIPQLWSCLAAFCLIFSKTFIPWWSSWPSSIGAMEQLYFLIWKQVFNPIFLLGRFYINLATPNYTNAIPIYVKIASEHYYIDRFLQYHFLLKPIPLNHLETRNVGRKVIYKSQLSNSRIQRHLHTTADITLISLTFDVVAVFSRDPASLTITPVMLSSSPSPLECHVRRRSKLGARYFGVA